jgi:hypothetical protein
MGLLFNEEIQSWYYQNSCVSVEGALLEWVDEGGAKHTRYFGHWSNDSKQDAATTTHNMRDELCINGDPLDLTASVKHMQSATWIHRGGLLVAVSLAAECIRLLSDPTHIKSKGMWAK